MEKRFVTIVDGKESVLSYREGVQNILEYFHTFVPPESRHQGIAAEIVEFGLRYARENGYKVRPTCPYVSDYVNKHPEWKDLIED